MTTLSSKSAQKLATPWGAVSLVFELGYIIALPAALFGFGGAYLDEYMKMSPLFLAVGLLLAFAISAFAVIGKVKSVTQTTL